MGKNDDRNRKSQKDIAGGADRRRCPGRHGGRRVRDTGCLPAVEPAGLRAFETANHLEKRRGCHIVFGRRTVKITRTTSRRRLVRRTCFLALPGGLGQFAAWASPR